ncbi:SLC26A/SulP transporter, partial [Kipferlia bialata]
ALIPEGVAFAFVAGVNPVVGLYGAVMMGLVTALVGARKGMISGATGAVAVIFAPMVMEQTEEMDYDFALTCLFTGGIVMGLMEVLFGVLKFGKYIRLVPHTVAVGFVDGLAIIIGEAQLGQFYEGSGDDKTLLQGVDMAVMIALICLTMAISIFLPRLTKAVPATLVALVTVTTITQVLSLTDVHHARTVLDYVVDMDDTVTTLAAGLPSFVVPSFRWEVLKVVLPYSALAAMVGLIESLMTLTLIDEITETRGRGNLECVGQGLGNIVTGLFGGLSGCAMIGQSMINVKAGGRGRASGISAALFMMAFVLFGSKIVEIIPLSGLVGVMFVVVWATFEWGTFSLLRHIPKVDAAVILIVTIVTVLEDLAIAVMVGCILSSLAFAWKVGKKVHCNTQIDEHGTKVYQLEGPLFFGSAQSFKTLFDYRNDPQEIVIDFRNSRVHDHSGVEAINNVTERYAQNGKKLHLLNLSAECHKLLRKAASVIEVSVIKDLDWHICDDALA